MESIQRRQGGSYATLMQNTHQKRKHSLQKQKYIVIMYVHGLNNAAFEDKKHQLFQTRKSNKIYYVLPINHHRNDG